MSLRFHCYLPPLVPRLCGPHRFFNLTIGILFHICRLVVHLSLYRPPTICLLLWLLSAVLAAVYAAAAPGITTLARGTDRLQRDTASRSGLQMEPEWTCQYQQNCCKQHCSHPPEFIKNRHPTLRLFHVSFV